MQQHDKIKDMKYKVCFYLDNLYKILELDEDNDTWEPLGEVGTLSHCEAYIRLKENDNVDF